ncbi:MAG TPA: DUF3303 family protein [Mycobacterium sp.]|nr:DUF3303 family protein [Mycobacterium sp.]
MKQFVMTTYRYKSNLDESDFRELTKRFVEVGEPPGVVAHYERLDGSGGVLVQETQADPEASYRSILHYTEWIEFDSIPMVTMDEAFGVIQQLFG